MEVTEQGRGRESDNGEKHKLRREDNLLLYSPSTMGRLLFKAVFLLLIFDFLIFWVEGCLLNTLFSIFADVFFYKYINL